MFALLNKVGQRLGQIPPDDQIEWYGRRFSKWTEETTLTVGNPLFFSLMDALIATSIENVSWDQTHRLWVCTPIILGIIITVMWFKNATRDYASGKIPSWGWQWCKPGAISIAGYWHTGYFLLHSIAMSVVLTFLLWQDGINIHVKVGMIFAITGYVSTFVSFINFQKRLELFYNRIIQLMQA